MTSERGNAACSSGPPLTEDDAEAQAHGIAFKTGPPGRVGVELEWLVCDGRDPALPVDQRRVAAALARLDEPGALPGRGRLTTEPGGQVELSSAPASGLGGCVAAARSDLTAVRQAIAPGGLSLAGHGLDPLRPPRRVLDLPRYAAMEEFFDRSGPWGRVMMCSTASVQVCVDAGQEQGGPVGLPVALASPARAGPGAGGLIRQFPVPGRPAVRLEVDPAGGVVPARSQPDPGSPRRWSRAPRTAARGWPEDTDPRAAWVSYVLDAQVMVLRDPGSRRWTAPSGLTFRDWVRGAVGPPPTADDLRLSHVHPVPAGPAARAPGAAGDRRPAGRRLDRADRRGVRPAR